jgi:hypothetical protein
MRDASEIFSTGTCLKVAWCEETDESPDGAMAVDSMILHSGFLNTLGLQYPASIMTHPRAACRARATNIRMRSADTGVRSWSSPLDIAR